MTLTLGAVLAFLTALIPLVMKLWPAPKTQGEKIREKQGINHAAFEKFETTGDTSDLGNLPD